MRTNLPSSSTIGNTRYNMCTRSRILLSKCTCQIARTVTRKLLSHSFMSYLTYDAHAVCDAATTTMRAADLALLVILIDVQIVKHVVTSVSVSHPIAAYI